MRMEDTERGSRNPGFVGDNGMEMGRRIGANENETVQFDRGARSDDRKIPLALSPQADISEKQQKEPQTDSTRQTWDGSGDFLMSCIAMSVGLGNVWRFPFTAYENGGGAFLVPYLLVLFLVGKPCYYMETIIGQFTSRSSVKMWSMVPAFQGVGCAQMFSMVAVASYYCSIMALTLHYLFSSFTSQLPWSRCLDEWDTCAHSSETQGDMTAMWNRTTQDSALGGNLSSPKLRSSAELYFTMTVLNEKSNIDDGLGWPNLQLTICLLLAWLCILVVLIRGIHSSGKAAYFLALFPYVIMAALLVRSVTLEGSMDGILFFIKPNWSKLFEAKVWFAAVTQCFFSLNVCFGGLVTYSSYNEFRHNIYRDVMVITSMDTLTSLIAGFAIFGILGNLAHELGTDDISQVVRGGSGLAFISYPDAIAKFTLFPQLFSVLFFLMLFVLGIGSGIGLAGGIISIVNDQFPKCKHWHIVLATTVIGFAVGMIYCTPGGQFALGLVDFYAASFVVFALASLEVTGVFWVYGLENFLDDVEFMLGQRPSIYWRICWAVVTPLLLIAIFLYTLMNLTPLTYNEISYPAVAHVIGWILLSFGVLQVPFWLGYAVLSKRKLGVPEMFLEALKPSELWGPLNETNLMSWRRFKEMRRLKREKRISSSVKQFLYILTGRESEIP